MLVTKAVEEYFDRWGTMIELDDKQIADFLHRIFEILVNLLHISFGNSKIFKLDLEFSLKIKNRHRTIYSDAGLKISPIVCGFLR